MFEKSGCENFRLLDSNQLIINKSFKVVTFIDCFNLPRIYHTVILDDPYDDPDGLIIPPKSPAPTQEMLEVTLVEINKTIFC